MIFIDTVNRLNQLPEREDPRFQRRRTLSSSQDSLTLSEAAAYVQQITLSQELASELVPIDSILANVLEVILQQLEPQQITVHALSQLAGAANDWELVLQTPPAEKPNNDSPDYGDDLKPQRHKHNEKHFECTLHGSDNSQKKVTLHFNIQHLQSDYLTSFKNLPPIQHLSTPYQAEQLEDLPARWSFEIDQDGESTPLEALYSYAPPAKYTISATGLQIWLQRAKDSLPLLIGDTQCGYIYIGNYGAYEAHKESAEDTIQHSSDIDTSA